MKISAKKVLAVMLTVVMTAMLFTSCSISDAFSSEEKMPEQVSTKVDLNDTAFTFTYGELQKVLPADKLGSLFEDYDELSDEITITLSYNDVMTKFSDNELYNDVFALLSEEELVAVKNNAAAVTEYFVNKINDAKQMRPITQYSESFWTDNGSIKFLQDGVETDKKVKTAAKFFEYFTTKGVADVLPNGTTQAGDDLTDILYLLGSEKACSLTADDVVSAVSSLSYETQSATEKYTDENGKTAEREVEIVTGITRIVTIVLKDDAASVLKAYSMHDENAILDEMKKASSYVSVDGYSVDFDTCTITATFNAVTDNILTVTYDKNMIVSAQVNGVGDLEYLGKQDLVFNCTDRMEYHFGWENEAE